MQGTEHWTKKGDVRLFLWRKAAAAAPRGTILFVHGSSMASQPTFDLQVPGRPESSAMDWFAARGFDTWCLDNEGYGRSDKSRPINFDIANGADDLAAAAEHIGRKLLLYGISSGALKAALFAERHPERVARLALDAFVWTGAGSRTLAERSKKLPEFQSRNRRPIDRKFVHSIFARDHPGSADPATIEAFADAILALDDSVPTGTYVDMCSKLPLVDPAKLVVPTLILLGQYDGIAAIDDLFEFFKRLPNPDKQFSVMAGISQYDPLQSFAPVARIASGPYVLVVHPDLKVNSVAGLVAAARAAPGKIDYATSGNGSAQHLVTALFATAAGIELSHVPYKGSGQAMQDVLGGRVRVHFAGVPNIINHVRAGKLQALGVTTTQRWPDLPEVPTIAEAGVAGFEATLWLCMLAPAGTPDAFVQRVSGALGKALEDPEVLKQLRVAGIAPSYLGPQEFGAFMRAEHEKWGRVVRETGATIN